jgi:hypothetical protein
MEQDQSRSRFSLGIGSREAMVYLTSRAETNCRGRRATLRSAVLVSRSYRAPAMLDSNSEGFDFEGELGAILFRAGEDMMAACGSLNVVGCASRG